MNKEFQISQIFKALLVYFCAIFLASRLGTLIHELLGHGLTAELCGGDFVGFTLHLFSTGSCRYRLGPSSFFLHEAAAMAGIAMNLLTGAIALHLSQKASFSWLLRSFLLVFALVSIGSQMIYLIAGAYYIQGDPAGIATAAADFRWIIWLFFLILLAPISFGLATRLFRLQEEILPARNFSRRLLFFATTFMAAAVIYSGLYCLEAKPAAFLSLASWAKEEKAREAALKADSQGIAGEAKERLVEKMVAEQTPFPIMVPVVLILLGTGFAALLLTRSGQKATEIKTPAVVLLTVTAGIAALCIVSCHCFVSKW